MQVFHGLAQLKSVTSKILSQRLLCLHSLTGRKGDFQSSIEVQSSYFAYESTEEYSAAYVGTYVRTSAIDNLVLRFLKADGIKRQIISLGAGSDTRYFRLQKSKEYSPDTFVYHELDFKTITTSKISTITQNQNIFQCIPGDIQIPGDSASLHSPTYHIHPVDLRWPSLSEEPVDPSGKLQPLEFIDFSLSTLLISECCLIYLEPAAADAVLDYFAGIFPPETPLGLILYEPLNPFDSFGKVMVSNLASRGIVLRTLRKYHSLEIQKARLQTYGFAENAAADVEYLWEHWTGEDEKQRVAALEMVDEVEEWQLLAQHYCVVWGRRSEHDETWTGWRNLKD